MVVGANGTPGVCVLKRSMVYKQGLESVPIQNQRLVENIAMGPEQLLGNVVTRPVVMKVLVKWRKFLLVAVIELYRMP